jgi:hypothetical protein
MMAKDITLDQAVAEQLKVAKQQNPSKTETARVAVVGLDAVIGCEDGMLPPDAREKEVCAELDKLFNENHDERYLKAKRALAPRDPWNPEKDDDLAIRRMEALIIRGVAANPWAAAGIVAADLPNQQSKHATRKRVYGKYPRFIARKSRT